jgi:hypothetical protein
VQRTTSYGNQTIQGLTLLVERAWSLSYLESTDGTDLETLSALVAVVDEMHECVNYLFHLCQEVFVLQVVVERRSARVCPDYVRTDSIEGDVLFWQMFAVRPDEPYRTTEQPSVYCYVLSKYLHSGRYSYCFAAVYTGSAALRSVVSQVS